MASLERLDGSGATSTTGTTLHDLAALAPAYVSTVDSGNLAGLLIAVRQACLGIPDEPVFDRRAWRAAETALGMVGATASTRIDPKLRLARSALATAERSTDLVAGLDGVLGQLEELEQAIAAARESHAPLGAASEWTAWTRRLVAEQRRRVEGMETTEGAGRLGEATRVFPTLRDLSATTPRAAELIARLEALAAGASRQASAMDFSFLYDEQRALFSIGYQRHQSHPGPVVLRPPGLRGAAGKLRGHRQGRRPGGPLVPSGTRAVARCRGDRPDVLERDDVRVPDAPVVDALVPRDPS